MKKCNDKTAIYDKSDSLNLRKINEIIWTHNETEVAEADTWQSQTQTRPTRYRAAAARRGKTGTIEWANVNTARQRGGPTINGINHEDTLSVSGAAFVSLLLPENIKGWQNGTNMWPCHTGGRSDHEACFKHYTIYRCLQCFTAQRIKETKNMERHKPAC